MSKKFLKTIWEKQFKPIQISKLQNYIPFEGQWIKIYNHLEDKSLENNLEGNKITFKKSEDSDSFLWKFFTCGINCFIIIPKLRNGALSVDIDKDEDNRVIISGLTSNDNQKWSIKMKDNKFQIINKQNNKCLEIIANNQSNISECNENDSKQLFAIKSLNYMDILKGYFNIKNRENNFCLKNFGLGRIGPGLCGSHLDELWKIEDGKNGSYKIKSKKDDYFLTYSKHSDFNLFGINAKQNNETYLNDNLNKSLSEEDKSNLWSLDIFIDKDYKMLYNLEYNKCLFFNKIEGKINYSLDKCDDSNSKFAFALSTPYIEKFIGKWVLLKSLFTDLCIKSFESNEVKQSICGNEDEFIWKIERDNEDSFTFINKRGGLYLDDSIKIINETNKQIPKWKIYDFSEKNSFIFESNNSIGKCLDNKGISVSNAGYDMNICSDKDFNQAFKIEEI